MKLIDKSTSKAAYTKTAQGYIVAKTTIARTGVMDYFGHEFDEATRKKFNLDPNKSYPVYTRAEDLFSPKTIASFEGMPLTIEHPDDLEVNADDWEHKAVGHVQNVAPDGIELACYSYVQHAAAIAYLEKTGVRETSIGQDADIEMIDGKLTKTNIVGNHVAIVPSGRSGISKLGDIRTQIHSILFVMQMVLVRLVNHGGLGADLQRKY